MTTKKENIFKLLIHEGYDFSETVAFFLRDAGLALADIGRAAGVDRSYVKRVLDGKRRSRKVERRIARVLGFDPWKCRPDDAEPASPEFLPAPVGWR